MTESRDAVTEYVTVWKDHEPTKLRWGVPVVRCRDCEYASYDGVLSTGWCNENCREVRPDGFCSWGERKVER